MLLLESAWYHNARFNTSLAHTACVVATRSQRDDGELRYHYLSLGMHFLRREITKGVPSRSLHLFAHELRL
jgi:hypothetical protein